MKRLLLSIVTVVFLVCCAHSAKAPDNEVGASGSTQASRSVSLNKIDSFYDVEINGCPQRILVQSNDIANNPILLYLHGGPGSSLLTYSHLYSQKLKDHFIFVNWDQRGTAFSYHEGMDASKISEVQISDDARELIKYLTRTFHKKKVYLIGHSFGSVIGLQLVANNPEYFYAYIGVGQVLDYAYYRSVEITYKWLHETLEKANDIVGLKRIEADTFPSIDLVIKYGGHHRLSIDLDSLRKTSPYYYEGYLELARKGSSFSQYHVGKNPSLKTVTNKSVMEMNIPLYFFEGVNDHVIACAPELVVEYVKMVRAPKKEIIWFKDSAHLMPIEEPEKFQDELIRIAEENG